MPVLVPSLGLAYFPVPKNACTSLKELFYQLNEGASYTPRPGEDGRMVYIHDLPGYASREFEPEFVEETRGLAWLAVVRHPVRRLVSVFKNRVVAYRELSAERVGQEVLDAAGLPPDPSFDLFLERIEEYRRVSPSIAHHTALQHEFLGPDLSLFEHIHRLEEMPRLQALLDRLAGRHLPIPHLQRDGSDLPDPLLTQATLRRMLAYCAPDLEYLSAFYGVD